MRFRSMLTGKLLLLTSLAGVLLLQQGIFWLDHHLAIRRQQNLLIEQLAIEPAALFYTELATALAAEKTVRQQLQQPTE